MLRALVAVLALASVVNAQYNYSQVADLYISLGEEDHNPSTVNCTRYAMLFTSDAILHQPGVPDVQGTADIEQSCVISHGQVNPVISFSEFVSPVTSWNTEKRLGISWVINGIRVSDGAAVAAPAISALFQDTNGLIEEAWSFYDDTLVAGSAKFGAPPPFNASTIIDTYIRLGASESSPTVHDCNSWAALYEPEGISNEPGLPPTQGDEGLVALCQRRVNRWQVFVPSVQVQIPVMSWNLEKRLAFQWTIAGVTTTGQSAVVPAISVLFMDANGLIENAWDWWDTSILPPPPMDM